MKKVLTTLAGVLMLMLLACSKDSGPTGPSEPSILGAWDDAVAEEAFELFANHTYEWVSYLDTTIIVDEEMGTWSLSGDKITFTETNCASDPEGCNPAITYGISVTGNKMTLTLAGTTWLTLTKQ